MFAALHAPGIVDTSPLIACAGDFSPVVERTSAETVTFDAGGLARLFRTRGELAEAIRRRAAEAGVNPNIALAANPDAAVCAARGFPGITLLPPGTLAPLGIETLEPSPVVSETLRRWGIRTCAQLAALPESGIAERLGDEGVLLRRLACGTATRPLRPAYPPPAFEGAVELEYPLTLLESLAFLMSRLLNDICGKLQAHGLATHELRLRLKLENLTEHVRTLRLPYPMRDPATFLKLLQFDMDAHPPKAPIVAVALSAEPVNPRVVQHGLFIPLEPEPQKLELTLARIAKIVGEGNVGSPELVDTHRPGAFRMKRFVVGRPPLRNVKSNRLAFRVFRPSLQARVQALSGQPVRISARGVQGNIVSSAGPWRTSGDWWSPQPWAHDEWDIALQSGGLYRIYKSDGGWYVGGAYD